MNTRADSLGSIFRVHRELRGLTVREVAQTMRVSVGHLYSVESGSRQASPKLAVRLALFFDLPMKDFVTILLKCESRCATLCKFAETLSDYGCLAAAQVVWNAASALNRSTYHSRYAGRIYHGQGKAAYLLGDYRIAAKYFERMVHAAQHDPRSNKLGIAYYDYGQTLHALGHQAKALQMYAMALQCFALNRSVFNIGVVRHARGLLLLEAGFYDEALADFRSSVHCFRGAPNRYFEAILGMGSANLGLGQLDNAERAFVAARKKCGTKYNEARALTHLAVVERQRGHLENAQRYSAMALDIFAAEEAQLPAYQAALLEAGVIAGLRGDAAKATKYILEIDAKGAIQDASDAGAFLLLSTALGIWPKHQGDNYSIRDDYTRRTAAALAILRTARLGSPT